MVCPAHGSRNARRRPALVELVVDRGSARPVVACRPRRYGRVMDFRTESVVGLAEQVRRGDRVGRSISSITLWSGSRPSTRRSTPSSPSTRSGPAPRPTRWTPRWRRARSRAAGRHPHRREGPRGRRRVRDHATGRRSSPTVAPAAADSPLVARLVAAGCVVVGKTNTPELGWKADTDNPAFGPTLNPVEPRAHPGRLVRGERGRDRRRGWSRWPPGPTAAARSASRRRAAACRA